MSSRQDTWNRFLAVLLEKKKRTFEDIKGTSKDVLTLMCKSFGFDEFETSDILTTFDEQVSSKLTYKPPHPLLETSGAKWDYQESQNIQKKLEEELPNHFKYWKEGKRDKQLHPLFLVWSGPGTGKSRLLEEFQSLCLKASTQTPNLHNRFTDAYVFKITFENGTRPQWTQSGGTEIGVRMLYQLQHPNGNVDFDDFAKNPKNQMAPGEVLVKLAEAENKDPKDMTIFILVDGAHELPHNDGQRNSMLKTALDNLASLVNGSPFFVVAAIGGTWMKPISVVLSASPQRQIQLTPPLLDGHTIIKSEDPLIRQFVDDMGGYGRALEILQDQLKEYPVSHDFSPTAFMTRVLNTLELRYPNLRRVASNLIPALIAVITRQRIEEEDAISLENGKSMTVYDLVNLGLFQWKEPGFLHCPFVLVWLLARHSKDQRLSYFQLAAYDETLKVTNEPGLPIGLQCWQHWEEFVARFRVLKSILLDGKVVPISQLHAGAQFGVDSDLNVHVKKLDGPVYASFQFGTASGSLDIVKHETGTVTVSQCNAMIINGTGAPAGDVFCGLKLAKSQELIREIFQCKHTQDTVAQELFDEEFNKAAAINKDLFVLFTTQDANIKLPARTALVCKTNFQTYFGPFAGRAFRTLDGFKPDINKASRAQLLAANGIGKAWAEKIIQNRTTHGPFKDKHNFEIRLQPPASIKLHSFRF